ncbi:hypothetical protein N7466_007484 [Penicillium verhagenii]|uniref:uncharacterized protein n=1 Tax=Penicillium verhagenii TaxID=1562060 RepID=UPI0025451781|nr:uncharacterized protein N7466_007484 [Penicillium verhagenii]KAJ5928528.1 hypothetical protein N7466_007484 [Penicillium verhagenii]
MGDATRPFRPIAPRTSTPGGGAGVGPPNNGGPSDEGRMKRASTACKECQKRRTRCSGVPCTECQAHERECVFDELSDRRRKASAKKTQEELNNLRDFLDQLLGAFRSNDSQAVQHLVNTIRSGASHEEIHRAILEIHSQTSGSPSHPASLDPNVISDHMNIYFRSY